MRRPLGDICLGLAALAEREKQNMLGYLLKMAATEAYENSAPTVSFGELQLPVVGLWDWDVPNNIRHLDPVTASIFGFERKRQAVRKEQDIAQNIHPDDVELWMKKVHTVAKNGGTYEHQYRVIANSKVVWVHAKGQCTLDKSGRPERFPGALIDITSLKETAIALPDSDEISKHTAAPKQRRA